VDEQKKEELVYHLNQLLNSFLSPAEKQDVVQHLLPLEHQGIPISTFRAPLAGLEIIVKYLKEHEHHSLKNIAIMLKRKPTTIYTTYSHASRKYPQQLDVSDFSLVLPYSLFRQRIYSVLESIVKYLKEQRHLPLQKIAQLLHRHSSTIKTVYQRSQHKKL
jgi:plasmid maintenance system antidote protein VapI